MYNLIVEKQKDWLGEKQLRVNNLFLSNTKQFLFSVAFESKEQNISFINERL